MVLTVDWCSELEREVSRRILEVRVQAPSILSANVSVFQGGLPNGEEELSRKEIVSRIGRPTELACSQQAEKEGQGNH